MIPIYGVRLYQGDMALLWCFTCTDNSAPIPMPDGAYATHDLNAAHRFAEYMRNGHCGFRYCVEERA